MYNDFERGRECCRLYFMESETGTPAIIVCCNGEQFDLVLLPLSLLISSHRMILSQLMMSNENIDGLVAICIV